MPFGSKGCVSMQEINYGVLHCILRKNHRGNHQAIVSWEDKDGL
jgi:hypothetical protein